MSRIIPFDTDVIGEIENFDGSEVIVTPSFVFFWKPPAIYGQWTTSYFTVDGIQYTCAEQFMMAEKARLFGDVAVEKQILSTNSPKAHKSLGRKVKGFQQEVWEEHRLDIVTRGNIAKFSQNSEMAEALLATGSRELVEASPYDQVWGIGLRADNPIVTDKSNWCGLNLLGIALMQTRETLLSTS